MNLKSVYKWERFWRSRTDEIHLDERGFMEDPELYQSNVLQFEQINHIRCIVLLGEPGIGKSEAVKAEIAKTENEENCVFLRYELGGFNNEIRLNNEIFENSEIACWTKGTRNLHLFLDGLDECLLDITVFKQIITNAIKKYPLDRLFLRIVCRTADWPVSLENDLIKFWSDEQFKIYELTPLRKKDVIETAEIETGNADPFMVALYESNTVPLAIKPLTLRMLIKIFKETGRLPSSKYECYEKGCRLLCDENNESRRDSRSLKGNLNVEQKMIIASRIAAITMLSRKASVWMGRLDGDYTYEDVMLSELEGKYESNGKVVEIKDDELKETISSGLFTSRGSQKMGFAHQTYQEYLAAKYIKSHNLHVKQKLNLLCCYENSEYRVIPQLYGVTQWLAGNDPELFEQILKYDPELLVRSDLTQICDNLKKELIDKVLKEHEERYLIVELYENPTLTHANIEEQLCLYMSDKTKPIHVRNYAMEIMIACKAFKLFQIVVKIVLDEGEPIDIRRFGAQVVLHHGDVKAKLMLKTLVINQSENDVMDSLKGIALIALWPEHITAEEMFFSLTPPKREYFYGEYRLFILSYADKHIKPRDLDIALKWAEKECSTRRETRCFQDLVDSIMLMAFEIEDNTKILELFSRVAFTRLKHQGFVMTHKQADLFYKKIRGNEFKRRKLLKSMLNNMKEDNDIHIIRWNFLNLYYEDDFEMLIELYFEESECSKKEVLADIIKFMVIQEGDKYMLRMYEIYKSDLLLKEKFSICFEVKLGSDIAEQMKRNYMIMEQNHEYNKENNAKEYKKDNLNIILNVCDSGDVGVWWKIKNELMNKDERREYNFLVQKDIMDLSGWDKADSYLKTKILYYAEIYLREFSPNLEEWFCKDKYYYPDFGAYWALRLLYQINPKNIDRINVSIWEKITPVIVAYPNLGGVFNSKDHIIMLKKAYELASSIFVKTLLKVIENADKKSEKIHILNILDTFSDKMLNNVLFDLIKTATVSKETTYSILKLLLKRKMPNAIEYTKNKLTTYNLKDEEELEMFLDYSALIVLYTGNEGWELVYHLVKNENKKFKIIIERITSLFLETDERQFLLSMSCYNLANLYLIIKNNYVQEDDVQEGVVKAVTKTDEVIWFGDRIFNELIDRKSDDSCKSLEYISNGYSDNRWIKHKIMEMKIELRKNKWYPPTPSDISKLIVNKRARVINTGEQLIDLLCDTLECLESEMQGETPSARDLWNETCKRYRPKDESALSDYLKRYFDKELQDIIVNREVQIRKYIGGEQGQNTDIHVDAIIKNPLYGSAEKIKIIIEVKGCWNDKLESDLKDQLWDRYLQDNPDAFGIYVVGWFKCKQWDSSDYRSKKCKAKDIDSLRKNLGNQANTINKKCGTERIRSYVLNATLH